MGQWGPLQPRLRRHQGARAPLGPTSLEGRANGQWKIITMIWDRIGITLRPQQLKKYGSQPPEDYGKWQHDTATKWRFVFIYHDMIVFYVFIIRLLEGNTSEGQLPLLQNEIGYLHVVFRWVNYLATKWLSIFKNLSNYRNVDNL